jgi:ABC-type transport system substrate-binding protein/signal transduction histidine kinase
MRVALLSVDPIGLTPFTSFDPDSFSLMSTIADALIAIDENGVVQPALATAWERTSPLTMEFELRRGVRFHDGTTFDSEDVVATFDAHRSPTPSACGGGILGPIVAVQALGPYRLRVETAFPDGMLIRRLFFGQIYSKQALRAGGREAVARAPVATGPYRFVRWDRGQEIVLERNPHHFGGQATVDHLHLPIIRKKQWVARLASGELDVVFNADALDVVLARTMDGLSVQSRPASVAHTFLLRNRGPLADLRVRRAMNHALQRRILVDLSEHGMGEPQRSVSTRYEEGAAECQAYRYSPELARRLLVEAGHADGLRLRGVVSETSTSLFHACREFLARVGIELEAEIVPASEWMSRIVLGNLSNRPCDTDFALTSMGNPLAHALFLQFANLFSQGPGSLTRDPEYDAEFLKAATVVDPILAKTAVEGLERYATDRALMLFTTEQQAHCLARVGCEVVLPLSGLPTGMTFASLRVSRPIPARGPIVSPPAAVDYSTLLEGTSHSGTFYLPPDTAFSVPAAAQIWSNILASQERWRLQNRPLLREVVNLVATKENLANVLNSTDRVAIVGYTDQGRELFVNSGYQRMLGKDPRPVTERLAWSGHNSWATIRAAVDATGSWFGPIAVEVAGGFRSLYLTVSRAMNEEQAHIGHTFVFSDFSGEEERIKNSAIRTILDNVPYALFACDRQGRVRPGYSATCLRYFRGATVEGQELVQLLELPEKQAGSFRLCYEQLIEDVLPSEVALDQLPRRLSVGPRICGLSGSVLRDAAGAVDGALFTLLDVTDLVAAEQEAERLRGLMAVLRFRSSFTAFVRQFHAELRELGASPSLNADARRALHTAKGVFGQFSLAGLARLIHETEDRSLITAADLTRIRSEVERTLQENLAVWDIVLHEQDPTFAVSEGTIRTLVDRVAATGSVDAATEVVQATVERWRRRSIAELVGPIEESCLQHAARTGKQVRVALHGFEQPVPLRIASVLNNLVHLTRNAVDHGLEAPADRGDKDPVGTLTVRARQLPDALELEVLDDGRGIDVDRLIEKAIALGALTRERSLSLREDEALELVFLDGVSAAKDVSQTSGRGIGMSALREAVRAVGGAIHIDSRPGLGTRVELRLPYSAAEAESGL